jgi:putative membrane protein
MDPAMVATGHWFWGDGEMFRGAPGWLQAFFTNGVFYGMPLSNWFGWLLTATLIARVMTSILPPIVIQERLSASPLLPALYLANGVMPVALCLRDGFWWAAASGALAMVLAVAWSRRADAGRSGVRLSPQRAS